VGRRAAHLDDPYPTGGVASLIWARRWGLEPNHRRVRYSGARFRWAERRVGQRSARPGLPTLPRARQFCRSGTRVVGRPRGVHLSWPGARRAQPDSSWPLCRLVVSRGDRRLVLGCRAPGLARVGRNTARRRTGQWQPWRARAADAGGDTGV